MVLMSCKLSVDSANGWNSVACRALQFFLNFSYRRCFVLLLKFQILYSVLSCFLLISLSFVSFLQWSARFVIPDYSCSFLHYLFCIYFPEHSRQSAFFVQNHEQRHWQQIIRHFFENPHRLNVLDQCSKNYNDWAAETLRTRQSELVSFVAVFAQRLYSVWHSAWSAASHCDGQTAGHCFWYFLYTVFAGGREAAVRLRRQCVHAAVSFGAATAMLWLVLRLVQQGGCAHWANDQHRRQCAEAIAQGVSGHAENGEGRHNVCLSRVLPLFCVFEVCSLQNALVERYRGRLCAAWRWGAPGFTLWRCVSICLFAGFPMCFSMYFPLCFQSVFIVFPFSLCL